MPQPKHGGTVCFRHTIIALTESLHIMVKFVRISNWNASHYKGHNIMHLNTAASSSVFLLNLVIQIFHLKSLILSSQSLLGE